MFSQRELEGYLLVDHSESPGITPEEAHKAGKGTIPVGAGKKLEVPTANCGHCSRLVILNPLRTRDRETCRKCMRYICDECTLKLKTTGVCYPFAKRIDDLYESAVRAELRGGI